MDNLGTLDLSWAKGYEGGDVRFLGRDVLCFRCGDHLKFLAEDGQESLFHPEISGLGEVAVHPIERVFAFSDCDIKPVITVISYPGLNEVAKLKDGAELEYKSLVFSNSEYIASITGVPDFNIILWRYTDGMQLIVESLHDQIPSCLSFNPANWRQLCIASDTFLSIWMIEQSDDVFVMQSKKIHLPAVKEKVRYEDEYRSGAISEMSHRSAKVTLDLPVNSIAGIQGKMAEKFAVYQDPYARAKPKSLCWNPAGDVLVGCSGGQVLKINGETFKSKIIYNPGLRELTTETSSTKKKEGTTFTNKTTLTAQKRHSKVIIHDVDSDFEEQEASLEAGAFDCIALHKKGLIAAGKDGVLRHFEITSRDLLRLVDTHDVNHAITSMNFNAPHNKLVLGSTMGSLHIANFTEEEMSLKQMFDIHHGHFLSLGVMCLNSDICVSVRSHGFVQIWNIENGLLLGNASLCQNNEKATSFASSPLASLVAIGTTNGRVYFLDCNNTENPRIVQCVRLHQKPVSHMSFNMSGHYLLTAADDGHFFIIDGRPGAFFGTIGHIDVPGRVVDFNTYLNEDDFTTYVVLLINSKDEKSAADLLMYFKLDANLHDNFGRHSDFKFTMKNDVIELGMFRLPMTSRSAALCNPRKIQAVIDRRKEIMELIIPDDYLNLKTNEKAYLLKIEKRHAGHQLSGGSLLLSPHQGWLASHGQDGCINIRSTENMGVMTVNQAHDFRRGGVHSIAFSPDMNAILTCGNDGTINCYKWKFTDAGLEETKTALEAVKRFRAKLISQQQQENTVLQQKPVWTNPFITPTPSQRDLASGLLGEYESEPGKDITPNISMADVAKVPESEPEVAEPASRPGSGVEKADQEKSEKEQTEDVTEKSEEHKILPALETDVTEVEDDGLEPTWLQLKEQQAIEEEDKQYADVKNHLRSNIKEMRDKLQGMMKENEIVPDIEQLDKHEFDLDIEEQNRLQAAGQSEVDAIRKEKELENLAKTYLTHLIRKECWDNMVVKGRGIKAFNLDIEVHNYPMKERSEEILKTLAQAKSQRQVEIDEIKARKIHADIIQKTMSTGDEEGEEEEEVEQPTSGSLGAEYGGGSDLFYNQFEIHTREQKINQIVLLEDAIHRIKVFFNKEFDEVFKKKEQELVKIEDRNRRIKKILDDIKLPDEVYEPVMTSIEKPEMLLEVKDEEVTVEKYLTPEQLKQQEEEQKAEEERLRREKGDNWRDRGLDLMMGGVLEIKKEDELKKDIPQPNFMSAKPATEWNDEEQKQAADYERRVRDLEEEREKYRKQLEMELRKLQGQIQESTQSFDENLQALFDKKTRTEMVIFQEELKILRLRHSLLEEEELQNRENELNDMYSFKKEIKSLALKAEQEAKKNVEAFREQYDILTAEDKVMDKAFRREFHDIPGLQIDLLYKLFRRRPRGTKMRPNSTDTGVFDSKSGNPFFDRPSTAKQGNIAQSQLENALTELDNESHMPEGVDISVWERMCAYRRQKIKSEQLVKQKALVLADMQAFLQKRQEEDEELRHDIDNILAAINRLKEDKMRFRCNLEVQLMLKQGQVEVESGDFIPSYTDSILIHRSVVEDLNANIKMLGESKINSMVESKDFRKSIVQLEWEHRRMTMEMVDLKNRMKDIQNLKVTREIQLFLNEENYDNKKMQEIQTLEQTILTQRQNHEDKVKNKLKTLKDLQRTINMKTSDNTEMSEELEDLNVDVNQRRHVHGATGPEPVHNTAEVRYKAIIQRRKLVELAKAQAQEVAVLRAEVERLRMRTFPALVQIEH